MNLLACLFIAQLVHVIGNGDPSLFEVSAPQSLVLLTYLDMFLQIINYKPVGGILSSKHILQNAHAPLLSENEQVHKSVNISGHRL